MVNIGDLSADGYGMMVFSTDLFNEYVKNKKWRAKKYLSFFDKNKECFYQIIKDGIIVPIYKIPKFEYEIFVKINDRDNNLPEGYKEIYRYNDFYMEAGNSNKLCFANFEVFEYNIDLIKNNITEKSEIIPTGPEEIMEKYNLALGLDIEKGKYNYNLIGLKRIHEKERQSKNYGYLFEFTKNENAVNDNFNKADDEKYIFSILEYEGNKEK
ncbi:MAG: hypothetical protein LBK13_06510 [Spirochaetales bacterium]|jgi:hypothetical protein|nr:hypothetical protein [Spirochaetales bacterium]